LNNLINETLKFTALHPNSGRKTDIENVRVKIIRNYLLFYEVKNSTLVVLTIWDERRSDKTLIIK